MKGGLFREEYHSLFKNQNRDAHTSMYSYLQRGSPRLLTRKGQKKNQGPQLITKTVIFTCQVANKHYVLTFTAEFSR